MTGGCDPLVLHVDVDVFFVLCQEAEKQGYNRTLDAALAEEALAPRTVVRLEPVRLIHLHSVNEDGVSLDSEWVVRCRAAGVFHGGEADEVGLLDVHADVFRELRDRQESR